MKTIKFTLLAIMLTISVLAFAQNVSSSQEKKEKEWIPKVSGFAQIRYDMNFDKNFELKTNTFFLQRVRVNFDGKLAKNLTYRVGGDFIRKPALTDAYVKYKINDALSFQAGQMKTPLSFENQFNPAFDCEMFDYATVIKQLTGYENGITGIGALGRDIGVMASGSLFKIKKSEKDSVYIIEYKVGVFNGNGINNKDNDNSKDVIGRIDFHPWIKELTITGSYQNGMYKNEIDTALQGVNNRWSFGFQYKTDRIIVRSEYIGGKTGREIYEPDNKYNKPFNSNGFYATAGYWFNLDKEGKQKLMPVVRYERLEKDESVKEGAVHYLTAGVYYLPLKQLNFKLNYQYINPEKGDNAHAIVAILNYKF